MSYKWEHQEDCRDLFFLWARSPRPQLSGQETPTFPSKGVILDSFLTVTQDTETTNLKPALQPDKKIVQRWPIRKDDGTVTAVIDWALTGCQQGAQVPSLGL